MAQQASRLAVGEIAPVREFTTLEGERIAVQGDGMAHLQFRRFAGCPVCNLHLRSIVARHEEIKQAGIREIVFFHSTEKELKKHASGLPFAVVADPEKSYYAAFGAEAGRRALLDPRAWLPILRSVAASLWRIATRGEAPSPMEPEGGRFGLPADFLIASDGRILACKYGEHVYDQWSVDELLSFARQGADTLP